MSLPAFLVMYLLAAMRAASSASLLTCSFSQLRPNAQMPDLSASFPLFRRWGGQITLLSNWRKTGAARLIAASSLASGWLNRPTATMLARDNVICYVLAWSHGQRRDFFSHLQPVALHCCSH